jgi:hypothetical protein
MNIATTDCFGMTFAWRVIFHFCTFKFMCVVASEVNFLQTRNSWILFVKLVFKDSSLHLFSFLLVHINCTKGFILIFP